MKIFIICCLLFIHVNMCIFIRGFRVSIRVSGIRSGFGYPQVWFWWWISTRIGVRFGFGFRLRVLVFGAQRLHPIRTRPVAILNYNPDNSDNKLTKPAWPKEQLPVKYEETTRAHCKPRSWKSWHSAPSKVTNKLAWTASRTPSC
jgi:hypothetical protein